MADFNGCDGEEVVAPPPPDDGGANCERGLLPDLGRPRPRLACGFGLRDDSLVRLLPGEGIPPPELLLPPRNPKPPRAEPAMGVGALSTPLPCGFAIRAPISSDAEISSKVALSSLTPPGKPLTADGDRFARGETKDKGERKRKER